MNTLRLHYLLRYHLEQSQRAPLHWDMHDPPTSARYHLPRTLPTAALSPEDLEMLATEPPVISLHIICDVLPCNSPIVARNFSGVTIHDVLFAIYNTLQVQINSVEWSALGKKQQDRVKRIFEGRIQRSDNSPAAHSAGVKLVGSLSRLYHILFAGLTPITITFPTSDPTYVLALRRAQPAFA